eukprot:scaffold4851_cov428-Prasinococcus_capsulatus_cf.AAC.18
MLASCRRTRSRELSNRLVPSTSSDSRGRRPSTDGAAAHTASPKRVAIVKMADNAAKPGLEGIAELTEQEYDELTEDNRILRENFEELKKLHLSLSGAHKELLKAHESLEKERISVEEEHRSLCDGWRKELEEKQQAMEEISQQMMQPHEVEKLRMELLRELEAPYRSKTMAMEEELSTTKEALHSLQREHRVLEVQMETSGQQSAQRLALLETDYEDRIKHLESQIVAFHSKPNATQDLEMELHESQRALTGSQHANAKLNEELEDMRRQLQLAESDRVSQLHTVPS